MSPLHRIGALARLTGVSTHAIRAWERRYTALSPQRTAGGARRYTDDDVRRLRLIKSLLGQGHAISSLATLEMPELSRLAQRGERALSNGELPAIELRAREAIDDLLAALTELDLERASRSLALATNAFSPRDLLLLVLAPALIEIGARWQTGTFCSASEHAGTAMFRTQLGAMLAAQPVPAQPTIVCSTPAGERHELGALIAAVVIAMSGTRAVYLGADLPTDQLVEAARLSNAQAVALSIVSLAPAAARREVDALCRALPGHVKVLIGGGRAAEYPNLPDRARVLASLPELENWLQTTSL